MGKLTVLSEPEEFEVENALTIEPFAALQIPDEMINRYHKDTNQAYQSLPE